MIETVSTDFGAGGGEMEDRADMAVGRSVAVFAVIAFAIALMAAPVVVGLAILRPADDRVVATMGWLALMLAGLKLAAPAWALAARAWPAHPASVDNAYAD